MATLRRLAQWPYIHYWSGILDPDAAGIQVPAAVSSPSRASSSDPHAGEQDMSSDNSNFELIPIGTLAVQEKYDFIDTNRKMKGRCWMDLLTVPENGIPQRTVIFTKPWGCLPIVRMKMITVEKPRNRLPSARLLTIQQIKNLIEREVAEVNTEDKFDITFLQKGVLHLEITDSPSGWSAVQILTLPSEILVGANMRKDFSAELVERGCPQEWANFFLQRKWIVSASRSFDSSRHSRESNTLTELNVGDFDTVIDTIVSGNMGREDSLAHIQRFLQQNPAYIFDNMQREMIARATNSFCYTNVVSTHDRFRVDLMTGNLSGSDNDIVSRWDERQVVYGRDDPYHSGEYFPEMNDTVYMSREHLSLWPFHDGVEFRLKTAIKICRLVSEFASVAYDNPHKTGKSDDYKLRRGRIREFYRNETHPANKLPRKALITQKMAHYKLETWQIDDCFK
ncbi:hypothetical protein C8R43DRAFT_1142975 [Mycena crocata]|nr:hypothetical protein C8R43DRAFT_1142975 [Mycena crocata]